MRTVTDPLHPLTRDFAGRRNGRNDGWCCDLRCYRVTSDHDGRAGRAGLDQDGDAWPAETITTTRTARTRTAPGSRAGSTRKGGRPGTGAAGPTGKQPGSRPGTPLALLALLLPPASHLHAGVLVLAVLAAAIGYVLLALARPTRRCPRCHGERITRSGWRHRIIPCRRCSGTGRAPRRLGPLIHRTYWTIRHERNHRP